MKRAPHETELIEGPFRIDICSIARSIIVVKLRLRLASACESLHLSGPIGYFEKICKQEKLKP